MPTWKLQQVEGAKNLHQGHVLHRTKELRYGWIYGVLNTGPERAYNPGHGGLSLSTAGSAAPCASAPGGRRQNPQRRPPRRPLPGPPAQRPRQTPTEKDAPFVGFLKTASPDNTERAIVNSGCRIKNNTAASIINKNLDTRNYSVSGSVKVFLFHYDVLESFTEVKIRGNQDITDGEKDLPDWRFEEGGIFLLEEIGSGLRIPNRNLRSLFSRPMAIC